VAIVLVLGAAGGGGGDDDDDVIVARRASKRSVCLTCVGLWRQKKLKCQSQKFHVRAS
jgi:hypothetical protein